MKKLVFCILFCIVLTVSAEASGFSAELPYDSYTYNYDDKPLKIPAPFVTEQVISGYNLGIGAMKDISDLFYDGLGYFYICDTGNNRIIILDENKKVIQIIQTFDNGGVSDSMNGPSGVFANKENIYVADTQNFRILMFSRSDFKLEKVFLKPKIELLNDKNGNYSYLPSKIAVDSSKRIYVIAQGVNRGLIRLSNQGEFMSFIGAPSVIPDFSQLVWRQFATDAQKERLVKFVPTEFDSLWIDENGFIYASSKTAANMPVVRLNSKGENVLPSIKSFGDSFYKTSYDAKLSTYFVDAAVGDDKTLYTIDSNQGKIYGYSAEGKLLYVFGTNAFQDGAFYSASAIELMGNRLYISDRSKGTITVFSMTDFGTSIHNALKNYRLGLYDESRKAWEAVYSQCSNYVLASTGIAQVEIQNGNYQQALHRLKSIHDHKYYSLAFEKWRNDFIRNSFSWILLVLIVLIVLLVMMKRYAGRFVLVDKIKNTSLYQKYKYGTYVSFHPFDGFWDIKREGRGDVKAATLILVLFTLFYGIRSQFSGYVVTRVISGEVNALFKCAMILLPLLFWIISNWCFTTLMDGKGTIKDIYVATCYALKPYVLLSIPLFILSHILTSNEAMFYQLLDKLCIAWVIALVFFGMMVTHDYLLSKGVLAAVLTLVGICLIIFILLLLLSIIQNILQFSLDIYKEISLQLYE